jgi:hypothetical protein
MPLQIEGAFLFLRYFYIQYLHLKEILIRASVRACDRERGLGIFSNAIY